jgi:uncharacterized protein YjbJ (UPF0337 family)
MSQNRIDGAAHKAAGAIKEVAGKMTGNRELQAKGVAEKILGAAQGEIGRAQDNLRSGLRR